MKVLQTAWRAGLSTLIALLVGCHSVPEECGQNVRRILHLDFNGPTTIKTTSGFDFAEYDVTIIIEKDNPNEAAQACYLVKDEDPWYKLFWAMDDILDANLVEFPAEENSLTLQKHFVLWAKGNHDLCWTGAFLGELNVEGCAGEKEAEIYLQPLGSPGSESIRHKIRVVSK
jgi:hypothetical protein